MKVSIISTVVAAAFITSVFAAPAPVPNKHKVSHKPSFRPVNPEHIYGGNNADKRRVKRSVGKRTSHESYDTIGTHCDTYEESDQLYGNAHKIHQISKDLKNSGMHHTIQVGECFEIGCLPDKHGAHLAEDYTGAVACQLPTEHKREPAQVSTHEMGRGLDKIVEVCSKKSLFAPEIFGMHGEKAYEVFVGSGYLCSVETLAEYGVEIPTDYYETYGYPDEDYSSDDDYTKKI